MMLYYEAVIVLRLILFLVCHRCKVFRIHFVFTYILPSHDKTTTVMLLDCN